MTNELLIYLIKVNFVCWVIAMSIIVSREIYLRLTRDKFEDHLQNVPGLIDHQN